MLPAPIPDDDGERLAALHALLILDTPPEERCDKIVAFAAAEFDVPIALISLLDDRRQWFQSRVGLEVCETARDISFCGHAIVFSDIMVVPDAPPTNASPTIRSSPACRESDFTPARR